jgi:DNA polymerase epsilon subunit 1
MKQLSDVQAENLLQVVFATQQLDEREKLEKTLLFLNDELKADLLKIIPYISRLWQRRQLELEEQGTAEDGENPVVDFIKYIIEIAQLYPPTTRHVRTLRRELLQVVGIKEFDAVGMYQAPTHAIVLKQVMCGFCSMSHDVNLTSLAVLRKHQPEPDARDLACPHCQSNYPPLELEQRLMDDLIKRLAQWQVQDLNCETCRMVTNWNLKEQCSCSRDLSPIYSRSEQEKWLGGYLKLSRVFDFRLLEELSIWIESTQFE